MTLTSTRFVILDRDGVINEDSDDYIKSPDEWQPIPGSLEAIASLNRAGYRVVVASNQSGIARGLFSIDTLNAIHRKLHNELELVGGQLDGIFFCPHAPSDNCACRKPRPGMLEQIAERFFVELPGVPLIGDTLRDLQAAESVGATPLLVRTGKGVQTEQQLSKEHQVQIFDDLAAAADHLIADD